MNATQINDLKDAGRKMLAKKDSFSSWKEAMNAPMPAASEVEAAKVFPLPPYKKLMKDGLSEAACNIIDYIRQILPSRPRGRYAIYGQLPRWADKVKFAREAVNAIIEDENFIYENGLMNYLRDIEYKRFHREEVDLRCKISFDTTKKLQGMRIAFCMRDSGLSGICLKPMTHSAAKMTFGREIGEHANVESMAAALESTERGKDNAYIEKLGVYRMREDGKTLYYIGACGVGRTHLILSEKNEDVNAVREDLNNNKERYAEILKEAGKLPSLRVHVDLWREGANSQYKNITNDEFMAEYGLTGITYGNYVDAIARQAKINATYDALEDLARVTGLRHSAIGLSGLGLQFGASGTGRAMAHFRPADNSINLTRDRGDGTLAHEWAHALDFRLGKLFGGDDLLSRTPSIWLHADRYEGTEAEKEALKTFRALIQVISSRHRNSFAIRSANFGRGNAKYWASEVELFARAFEAFVRGKYSGNDYLVRFKSTDEFNDTIQELTAGEYESYPYPTAEENDRFTPYFEALLASVKDML